MANQESQRFNHGYEVLDLPSSVRQALQELDAQIEQINQEMDAIIAEQDFEKAAHNLDRTKRLKKAKNDILGSWPSRFAVDPAWLTWNGGAVGRVAGVIHQEQRWQDLPVLADALEEAGCTDQEILSHCRQPPEHARRCWVVSLLLGKV
jgi:hypothetical protein